MVSVIINGKEIVARPATFKTLVDFEKMGFNITKMGDMPFSAMAAVVAYYANWSFDRACDEIEHHIENGGTFDDFEPLLKAITESSFFRNRAEQQD